MTRVSGTGLLGAIGLVIFEFKVLGANAELLSLFPCLFLDLDPSILS